MGVFVLCYLLWEANYLSPGLEDVYVACPDLSPWPFDELVLGVASSYGISGVAYTHPVVKGEEDMESSSRG
jgi:hypothetical protein